MFWWRMRGARDAYSPSFYRAVKESARTSAETIVPLVIELVPTDSVVDVGCGLGTWLAVFREQGARDILRIDGSWGRSENLDIQRERVAESASRRVWHARNLRWFVRQAVIQADAALRGDWERVSRSALALVHPPIFLSVADPSNQTAGRIVTSTVEAFRVLLRRALRR